MEANKIEGPFPFLLKTMKCILRCPAAVVVVLNSRRAVSNRPICGGERSVNCYAVLSQRYSVL